MTGCLDDKMLHRNEHIRTSRSGIRKLVLSPAAGSAYLQICTWTLLIFLVACDPAYHLRYAVLNDTSTPVYCVDRNKRGAASVTRVEPDSVIVVYEEAGIGFGKTQFKSSKAEVTQRFVFYSDSTLSDSTRIVPHKNWKYYRLPIGDYNARVYIREKDLVKK